MGQVTNAPSRRAPALSWLGIPALSWLDIALVTLACLLCSVELVQPMLSDHEIYARGGRVLLDGGHLYTDFIDVKPPLIFELFALCIALFGSSAMAFRGMEVALYVITVPILFRAVERHSGSRVIAHSAILVFAACVASLWIPISLQPETLAFLPIVLTIAIGAKQNPTWRTAIALGCVTGVLFCLKYPLVLAAIPAWWILVRRVGSSSALAGLKFTALTGLGFAVVVGVVFGIVWHDGIVDQMVMLYDFLRGYAGAQGGFVATYTHALSAIADFAGNDMSIVVTGLAAIGCVAGLTYVRDRDRLFPMTVAVLVALALSVLVERKFNLAHLSRLIPVMAILAAYGVPVVLRAWRRAWARRPSGRIVLVALALFILLLSPLPRVARSTGALAMVLGKGDLLARMSSSWREQAMFGQDGLMSFRSLDTALVAVRAAQPKSVVVLGLGGVPLYWYLPDIKKSKFADSHFFTTEYAPAAWNTEAVQEASDADVVVLLDDDANSLMSGHNLTTRDVLEKRPEWRWLFEERRLLRDYDNWSVWSKK